MTGMPDGGEPEIGSRAAAEMTVAQRRAAAAQTRREMLGDVYVNATAADDSPGGRAMRELVLDSAWSVWTRPGLARRDRSLIVMAMMAATGQLTELETQCRSAFRAGVTSEEIDELVLQVGAYCGAPAGLAARRVVVAIRAETT